MSLALVVLFAHDLPTDKENKLCEDYVAVDRKQSLVFVLINNEKCIEVYITFYQLQLVAEDDRWAQLAVLTVNAEAFFDCI